MRDEGFPPVRDLVLIGGGHAHALVLRQWGMRPMAGVRVTLITPDPVTPYTGMLPGLIAGHYAREAMMIDLVRLARFAGARIILDRAIGLDREAGEGRRRVLLAGRPPVGFDVASLDIGLGPDLAEVPGFASHGHAVRPLAEFAAAWQAFVARALPAPRLVVVGAGVGGVELALAASHRLRAMGAAPTITLLEQAAQALPGLPTAVRRALLAELEARGIALRLNVRPDRASADLVGLNDGTEIPSDFTLSVAGGRPQGWLQATGLALQAGSVVTGPTLQSSDPAVFAAGDCAHLAHAPRPRSGVYAVRAAPVLLHNLRAALAGGAMRRFQPQRDHLRLIALGGKTALGTKFGLCLSGPRVWRAKDRIDRRFMDRFDAYPASRLPSPPRHAALGLDQVMAAQPACGGCGAKIGSLDLDAALARLPAAARPDVISGPGDDAAILRVGGALQVISTDHLRAFTLDPFLMARIAAIHALGDVWAMAAAPQVALAQITLPRMGNRLQTAMLAEVMQAAAEVFRAAGADVVGGHTAIGAELTLGFTVTGLTTGPLTKAGARPGDALILTKPLGTGTIMAAEMAATRLPGALLGECVAGAFRSMIRPLGPAAAVLAQRAHAMTDVTGFGLAGHLMEMLAASGCAASLNLDALPLLAGAEQLAAIGTQSTLAPANRAALIGRISLPATARAALLFDPQTCGGLLAAVPADQAPALVAALRALGDEAAIVGTLIVGKPGITAA